MTIHMGCRNRRSIEIEPLFAVDLNNDGGIGLGINAPSPA